MHFNLRANKKIDNLYIYNIHSETACRFLKNATKKNENTSIFVIILLKKKKVLIFIVVIACTKQSQVC
jgi:hypothetical protein